MSSQKVETVNADAVCREINNALELISNTFTELESSKFQLRAVYAKLSRVLDEVEPHTTDDKG